jgi:signal recognition particle receptor subunit beta
MAVFDPKQQRMCVRLVYDGAASAGKTTNLRQLAEIFATQRTGELLSPAEMDGRTLYFDWLQIAAGMVSGFPLLCQVISVPGQVVLTPRRRHLLSTADAVVHVCDSEEQTTARAREGLHLFDEVEGARGERVPLVVQANKQDRPGAIAGAALSAALGRGTVPVVEAIASDGIGVIDTFVAAVRAVVRSIQARVERGDVRVAVRLAETADAVLERLGAEAVDPEWALELMLEEASNAFALGASLEAGADEGPPPTWRPASDPGRVPELPTEHVPTGFIWPAHTGRAALRALRGEPAMKNPVRLDPQGTVRLVLGDLVLSTTRDRRYDTAEAARQALVRAARERTQLGPLLAPETVLVAQPARDDSSWLWTVLPRMPTVADLVASRDAAAPPRGTVLAAYGGALADALRAAALHGLSIDLAPASFGVRHGLVRYAGDLAAADASRNLARQLLDALAAVASVCDVEAAVGSFEAALASRLGADDLAKIAQATPWRDLPSVPEALRPLRLRVEKAVGRGRKAA